MRRVLLLHHHEIWLKGGNRAFFMGRLRSAIQRSLEGLAVEPVEDMAQRLIIRPRDEAVLPEALERLSRVFGLAYFATAAEVPADLAEITAAGCAMAAEASPESFAIRAKVAERGFSLSSVEIERALGRSILDHLHAHDSDVRVNLDAPQMTCWVEIVPGRALVYTHRIEGARGLPAGTAGRLVCLLSGGFDSAVAAYKMMRRGVHLAFVHFYGAGSPSRGSSQPVAERIVRALTPYQFSSRLYSVDFDAIQRQIVAGAPEALRVLLYRRMMARIAREITRVEKAHGLVTGDSVSQVASQTLHNLAAIDHGLDLPVYRPLAGDDKEDIVRLARQIGTYTISCEPFEDCCPRFMPRSPAIFSTAEELARAESGLDVEGLVTQGLEATQALDFAYEAGQVTSREMMPRRLERLVSLRKGVATTARVSSRLAEEN